METVLKLTASSTAASAGITAIPGDAGTPIAEKLADFSEYGILILCVLYAEKYLLSILGSGVFKSEILNRFIESLAVMIVTSCVIPILVLLFSLWIINQVFGFSIPAPSRHPRLRPHLSAPRRGIGRRISSVPEEPEDEDLE